jgi:RNA polymerase sigma-70 factor (ECF subfamily)
MPPEAHQASAAQSGLELLYRNHCEWLRRALRYRLRGANIEIEDVVQDTYVRITRYDSSKAQHKPKALLLRIALNLARDQFRRQSRQAANDVCALENVSEEGDQEYLLALKEAILGLPPDLQKVFLLARFTPLSNAQIAKQLGVSVKTVEYRMHQAMMLCSQRVER